MFHSSHGLVGFRGALCCLVTPPSPKVSEATAGQCGVSVWGKRTKAEDGLEALGVRPGTSVPLPLPPLLLTRTQHGLAAEEAGKYGPLCGRQNGRGRGGRPPGSLPAPHLEDGRGCSPTDGSRVEYCRNLGTPAGIQGGVQSPCTGPPGNGRWWR